jgi:hypothetical protein
MLLFALLISLVVLLGALYQSVVSTDDRVLDVVNPYFCDEEIGYSWPDPLSALDIEELNMLMIGFSNLHCTPLQGFILRLLDTIEDVETDRELAVDSASDSVLQMKKMVDRRDALLDRQQDSIKLYIKDSYRIVETLGSIRDSVEEMGQTVMNKFLESPSPVHAAQLTADTFDDMDIAEKVLDSTYDTLKVLAEELSDVHGEVADDFAAIQMSENGSPRYSFTDLDSLDGDLADFNDFFIADF